MSTVPIPPVGQTPIVTPQTFFDLYLLIRKALDDAMEEFLRRNPPPPPPPPDGPIVVDTDEPISQPDPYT